VFGDSEGLTPNPDECQSWLADFFADNSRELSEIYSGILHASHSAAFPNQRRVLAYQARELMDKAPRIMSLYGATIPDKPPTFAHLRKRLDSEYVRLRHKLTLNRLETEAGQCAVRGFLSFVESWLFKAEQARLDSQKLARSHVVGLEPGSVPPSGRALEIAVRQWISMKGGFNSILHGDEQATLARVKVLVSELEGFFLLRLRPRPFENQAQLDRFLSSSPDALEDSEIKHMLDLIGSLGVNYRYFFQNVDSPIWIRLFEEREFFRSPPKLLRIEGQIHAPDWPELAYLERILPDAEDEVGRIARDISRFQPENPRVHERLISIAAQLLRRGSKQGRRLLNSELDWIATQDRLLLRIPSLLLDAAVAAASDIPGLALRAIGSLLSLKVTDEVRTATSGKGWHRMGEWDLREILKRISEELVSVLPAPCQMHLLAALCDFIGLVGENEFESTDPRLIDNAFLMWRPAIEEHEQNDLNSLSSWAVGGVRDVAEALVGEHGVSVLTELEGRDSRTLLRVSLHLRAKHPGIDPIGTADLIKTPQLLGDDLLRHELFSLLGEQFESLPEEVQERYLSWTMGIEDPHRRHLYLWPVRHALPKSMLEKYQGYEEEFGRIEHPDLPVHHGVAWVGPTSPFSADQMASWSIPELVEKLNGWEYKGGWHSPEPEGVARELAAFAAQDAERVSKEAMALEGLKQPTYVRGIVQGLADAVKEGRTISWESVLHFCRWVVAQERGDEPEGTGLEEFDQTWGPARKQIAWLLRRGTEKSDVEIPFDLRGDVWAILEELLHDPNPTEVEERSRAEHMDPSTIAINTVRGVALGASLSYALCVARHEPQETRTWDRFGLSDLRERLEEQLAEDQSPAVRSLFGRWLQYLFWLDQEWTASNVNLILPRENAGIWAAAWDAYLTFCSALYVELLGLLRPSYEQALDRLGVERQEKTRISDPDERLGHHLVLFYREGALEEKDPLFTTFFEKADSSLRYSVMSDAVRQVQDIAEAKRDDVFSRLRKLWEWRLSAAVEEDADEHHELSSFAWWFLKDELAPQWRLEQLLQTQRHDIKLDLDGRVLEKLASLSEKHLLEVLRCLEAIVRNPNNEHWGIYDDHVKEILRRGLASDSEELRQKSEDLVHYIGSQGFLSFRELLGIGGMG